MKNLIIIKPDTHELSKDEEGNVITENNYVVATDKKTKKIFHLPITPALQSVFGFTATVNASIKAEANNSGGAEEEVDKHPTKWSDEASITLLNLHEQYLDEFKSTVIKRDVAFAKIAKIMEENGYFYTSSQCRDRYKYLKKVYMRNKRMGIQNFQYSKFFDESLDMTTGSKEDVEPEPEPIQDVLIREEVLVREEECVDEADSLQAFLNEDDQQEVFQPEQQQSKRRRVASVAVEPIAETQEEAKERRHQERMEVMREGLEVLKTIAAHLMKTPSH